MSHPKGGSRARKEPGEEGTSELCERGRLDLCAEAEARAAVGRDDGARDVSACAAGEEESEAGDVYRVRGGGGE